MRDLEQAEKNPCAVQDTALTLLEKPRGTQDTSQVLLKRWVFGAEDVPFRRFMGHPIVICHTLLGTAQDRCQSLRERLICLITQQVS